MLLLILFLLVGCENQSAALKKELLAGRYQSIPVYRYTAPASWHRTDPDATALITDTRTALTTFTTNDCLITVHNFPSNTLEERIAPGAQLERWKGQFEQIDKEMLDIQPFANGGFGGLRFEAQGIKGGKPFAMIAYAMQLTPVLYRKLSERNENTDPQLLKQMRADYTIKVIGPPAAVNALRAEVASFAESFELIHAVPAP